MSGHEKNILWWFSAVRILLVEDHERLASLVSKGLKAAHFLVEAFARGDEALAALEVAHYDAMILDLGLPDQDGLEVLRRLRGKGLSLPVLILTSRVLVAQRIEGLNAGADDYLTKPFDMAELIARLHALLRRPEIALGSLLTAGNLVFDVGAREASVNAAPFPLTPREAGLLEHLLRRAGKVVPKAMLEDSLYGLQETVSPNTIEVLAHRLRKKLESVDAGVSIHTVRGVGYLLTAETKP